eukprot:357307-Chlamydomonas_euryale.AAC.2
MQPQPATLSCQITATNTMQCVDNFVNSTPRLPGLHIRLDWHASFGNRDMWVRTRRVQHAYVHAHAGLPRELALVLSTAAVGEAAGPPAEALDAASGPAASLLPSQLSTAAGAAAAACGLQPSLLAFEYRSLAAPRDGAAVAWAPLSGVRLRLQRPTLVLDFPFLLQVLNFVSPSPVLQVRLLPRDLRGRRG